MVDIITHSIDQAGQSDRTDTKNAIIADLEAQIIPHSQSNGLEARFVALMKDCIAKGVAIPNPNLHDPAQATVHASQP